MAKFRLAPDGPPPPKKSSRPSVLALNSYAGSLLLAAKALKLDIVGSYEDVGFGLEWQRTNFPHLEGRFASHRDQWPTRPRLDETVVVAHPPCAAFSTQNSKGKTRGADSAHFACTLDVMRYAFEGKAPALLVESVPGALEGGAEYRNALAAQFKYRVFHVLQNAATFGLPQWRPRYWAVFLRSDQAKRLTLAHAPQFAPAGPFFDAVPPGDPDPNLVEWIAYQRKLLKLRKVSDEEIDMLMCSPGRLPHKIRKHLGLELLDACRRYCVDATCPAHKTDRSPGWMKGSPFVSHTVYELDPAGPSPSILWDSWWTRNGVSVTPAQYRAAGGFPTDYKLDMKYRMWLSKGVAPPVAAWLLDQVLRTLEGKANDGPEVRHADAGEVLDFTLTKKQWYAAAVTAPAKKALPAWKLPLRSRRAKQARLPE